MEWDGAKRRQVGALGKSGEVDLRGDVEESWRMRVTVRAARDVEERLRETGRVASETDRRQPSYGVEELGIQGTGAAEERVEDDGEEEEEDTVVLI